MKEEEELLPQLLPVTEKRAKNILELLVKNGVTQIRTQCNVDPIIGLKNLEAVLRALEAYQDQLSYEFVAFLQHRLLRSQSVGWSEMPFAAEPRSSAAVVGADIGLWKNAAEYSRRTSMAKGWGRCECRICPGKLFV